MTIDTIKQTINAAICKDGYVVLAWVLPKRIGDIAKVSELHALGHCCILSPATAEEFQQQWGRVAVSGYRWNYYRAMID